MTLNKKNNIRINCAAARLPAWVLGGVESRVLSHADPNLNIGRDYFEEFHIHFISSFMLCVLSAYTKKLSFLHVWGTLKKGGKTLKSKVWHKNNSLGKPSNSIEAPKF